MARRILGIRRDVHVIDIDTGVKGLPLAEHTVPAHHGRLIGKAGFVGCAVLL